MIGHNDARDKKMAIAGANDTDAGSATTYLSTPGFLWAQHPKGCLSFWYDIKVRFVESV